MFNKAKQIFFRKAKQRIIFQLLTDKDGKVDNYFLLFLARQRGQSRDLFFLIFGKAKLRIIFSCFYQTNWAKQRIIFSWFQHGKVGKVETYFYLFLPKQSRQSKDLIFLFLPKQSWQSRLKQSLIVFGFRKAKQAKQGIIFSTINMTKQRIIFSCFSQTKIYQTFQHGKVGKVDTYFYLFLPKQSRQSKD